MISCQSVTLIYIACDRMSKSGIVCPRLRAMHARAHIRAAAATCDQV